MLVPKGNGSEPNTSTTPVCAFKMCNNKNQQRETVAVNDLFELFYHKGVLYFDECAATIQK